MATGVRPPRLMRSVSPIEMDTNVGKASVLSSWLRDAGQRAKSLWQGRRGTVYELSHDPAGLSLSWTTVANKRGQASLSWSHVISVRAFKRDLYAVDLICLGFEKMDGSTLEVNEEMQGWDTLVERLPAYLTGFPPHAAWFRDVAVPAFKANMTVLYDRSRSGTG